MPSFTDKLTVNGHEMDMYASVPSGSGPFPAVVIAFHVGNKGRGFIDVEAICAVARARCVRRAARWRPGLHGGGGTGRCARVEI